MSILSTVAVFIITFGVLITFHEYGHFWAARRMGVRVLRFSIGFGKPIFSWRDRRDTEFVVTALPLGGYVKMLDSRDCDLEEYAEREQRGLAALQAEEFTSKSVWARIFVVAAGPVANLLLAFLVLWAVFMAGERGLAPVISAVESGSLAAAAGLEPGQEIVEIDGQETPTRRALQLQLLKRLGETGILVIGTRYPDSELVYQSEVMLDNWLRGIDEPNPIADLGVTFFRPAIELTVGEVVQGTAAAQAGLVAGDRLIAVDGQTLANWPALVKRVEGSPEQTIELEIQRAGKNLTLAVTPNAQTDENGRVVGKIGVRPTLAPWPEGMIREYRYSPLEALQAGMTRTWELSVFTLEAVKKMLFGQMSPKNLAGPITIAQVANDSAKAGFIAWLELLALLSISLGIMNLLPIPMLDGGHLLYFMVEVLKGSPVSERVQIVGQQFGLFVLISVFVLVMVNDIARL